MHGRMSDGTFEELRREIEGRIVHGQMMGQKPRGFGGIDAALAPGAQMIEDAIEDSRHTSESPALPIDDVHMGVRLKDVQST
jgi:hypothetical protein